VQTEGPPAPDRDPPIQAEGLFRRAFDRAPIGMAISDTEGRFRMVNRAYCDLVGRDEEALLSTTWMAVTDPRDRDPEEAFEREAVTRGSGSYRGEKRYIRPDGSVAWSLVSRSLVIDPVDGTPYFLRHALDIGDRKRTEELLRQQNEELAALHETTLALISRLEATSLLEAILTRAAALAETPHAFLYVVDEGADRLVLRAGIGVFGDYVGYVIKRGEGVAGRVWESGEAMAVGDYAGWAGRIAGFEFVQAAGAIPLRVGEDIVGVIGLMRLEEGRPFTEDEVELLTRFGHMASLALENARLYEAAQNELAERRRTEKELERTASELRERNEQLREADELKSHFVAVASHELRTPLTSVLGYASTLLRFWHRLTDDQRQSQVAIIEEQGQRLGRLVDDLLTMSRIDAGVLETRPEDVDLIEAVAKVVDAFPDRAPEIGLRVPDELQVRADPGHLAQILTNYVSNALRYGASPIEVEASLRDDWVEVRVRDHGEGVPAEFQGRLFEKFAQGPPSHGVGGTGLGLSIVRGLAQAQGGDAWYERNEPRGSCFAIRLPAPDDAVSS
jgi:PAS domain S-box-containing protein